MKTILYLFFIIGLCPLNTTGQNSPEYNRFYESYKNVKGIVSFKIPPGLLKLFVDKNEKEFKDILKKVDEISFFIADSISPGIFKELEKNLPGSLYHDVMIVKNGLSIVKFKARESKSGFKEIIMSVEDKGSLVIMCISGTFDYTDANSLARSIKVNEAVKFQQN